MASGIAALVYCLILGPRRDLKAGNIKPHNLSFIFLGTGLLWFGWLGFNGGSALAANPRAVMASLVTSIGGASGGLAWTFMDLRKSGMFSGISFCSGAIAGLAAITPASGFVAPWSAIIIGAAGGISSHYGVQIKIALGFDDSLDTFGIHAIAGTVGNILTGVFAVKWVAALDGAVIEGGWIEGNWKQMYYQVVSTVAIAAWSFIVSGAILLTINQIPGLQLRASQEEEKRGEDAFEMGESNVGNSRQNLSGALSKEVKDIP